MKVVYFGQDKEMEGVLAEKQGIEYLVTDKLKYAVDFLGGTGLIFIDLDHKRGRKVNKEFLSELNVKRVVISSKMDVKDCRKHQEGKDGADGYLLSPFESEDLWELIDDFDLDSNATISDRRNEIEENLSFSTNADEDKSEGSNNLLPGESDIDLGDLEKEVKKELIDHNPELGEEGTRTDYDNTLNLDIQDKFDQVFSENDQRYEDQEVKMSESKKDDDELEFEVSDPGLTMEQSNDQPESQGNEDATAVVSLTDLGKNDIDKLAEEGEGALVLEELQSEENKVEEVELEFDTTSSINLSEIDKKDELKVSNENVEEDEDLDLDSNSNALDLAPSDSEDMVLESNSVDDESDDEDDDDAPTKITNLDEFSLDAQSEDNEEAVSTKKLPSSEGLEEISKTEISVDGRLGSGNDDDDDEFEEATRATKLMTAASEDFINQLKQRSPIAEQESSPSFDFNENTDTQVNADDTAKTTIGNLEDFNLGEESTEATRILPQSLASTDLGTGDFNLSQQEHNSENINIPSDDEMIRVSETIRHLREERGSVLKELNDLRRDCEIYKQENLNLKSENDELKIEIQILKKRTFKDIEEYKYQYHMAKEKKDILEDKIRNYKLEFSKLNQKVRIDLNQIKQREIELENQLEMVKKDAENQVKNRDLKILELKRNIDALEFNMENVSIKEQKAKIDKVKLEDRLGNVMKTLRSSIQMLEEDVDIDEEVRKKIEREKGRSV